MKFINKLITSTIVCILLTGCSAKAAATTTSSTNDTASTSASTTVSTQTTTTIAVDFNELDLNTAYDATTAETITLKGTSIAYTGTSAAVKGTTITIVAGGDYYITGTLNDGQIMIDAGNDAKVHLFFENVSLTHNDGSALVINNADKTVITLMAGSVNSVTDGSTYTATGTADPDAAIYAKDDLTFNGIGTLNVNGNYSNGIHGTNDIKLVSSAINVTAKTDGIKGKDSVSIKEATINITATGDGIQSSNAEEDGKGFVYIDGGAITIKAGLDGIQAETQVLIADGTLTINSGNSVSADDSGKGIKAVLDLSIAGGNITIVSTDDALHTNGTLTVTAGTLSLSSGDDGMHADKTLTINGGNITIMKSYEGIESANILISGGEIHLTASDDGLNTSAGTSTTSSGNKGGTNADDGSTLTITGGSVYINANGDGLDSNGTFKMSGGNVIVFGPIGNQNAAIDYNGSFTLTGGTLLAVGSSGMAQQASSAEINSVLFNTSSIAADTLVAIVNSKGELIVAFKTVKTASSVVFASNKLVKGSYTVYTGGSISSVLSNQITTDGTYTKGTQLLTFTVSSTLTAVGSSAGNQPKK